MDLTAVQTLLAVQHNKLRHQSTADGAIGVHAQPHAAAALKHAHAPIQHQPTAEQLAPVLVHKRVTHKLA